MNIFSKIREFIWPLLEKGPNPELELLYPKDITTNEKYLEKTLEYTIKEYESEEERRKTVESKSSHFIGTISVVTSIVLAITSFLVKSDEFGFFTFLLVFLLFVLTIYMARTVWFSIKVLERAVYFTISIKDFLIKEIDDKYYEKLILTITNKIRKNTITINMKVNYMTMAQEYFKRAIVVIIIYSSVILVSFILKFVAHC
jgi:hypothetical protein